MNIRGPKPINLFAVFIASAFSLSINKCRDILNATSTEQNKIIGTTIHTKSFKHERQGQAKQTPNECPHDASINFTTPSSVKIRPERLQQYSSPFTNPF